ncbi:glycosyltransferase family 2 protein [bacterium]|nr:glycosyltransferase family 2 protein [bacterium]
MLLKPPLVSIVIPVYNREKFVTTALNSVKSQTFRDWELIIVDDGSSDNSVDRCLKCLDGVANHYEIVRQDNAGAGAARATGIKHCRGTYIAFLDSDDEWHAHHLESCVAALEKNPDIDWLCTDMERVVAATSEVREPSVFHSKAKGAAFLQLDCEKRESVCVLPSDGLTEHLILNDGFHSLQCSVLRSSIFDRITFPCFRVGEDRVLAILAAVAGHKLAYIDEVQVRFYIHTNHTAAVEDELPCSKRSKIIRDLLNAYYSLPPKLANSPSCSQALKQRLAKEHFWTLGYNTYWLGGSPRAAIAEFIVAIKLAPTNLRFWKTAFACLLKWPFVTSNGQ